MREASCFFCREIQPNNGDPLGNRGCAYHETIAWGQELDRDRCPSTNCGEACAWGTCVRTAEPSQASSSEDELGLVTRRELIAESERLCRLVAAAGLTIANLKMRVEELERPALTLTWPSGVTWPAGAVPTLVAPECKGDGSRFCCVRNGCHPICTCSL